LIALKLAVDVAGMSSQKHFRTLRNLTSEMCAIFIYLFFNEDYWFIHNRYFQNRQDPHQIHTGLERSAMFDKMFADNPEIHAMVKTKEVQVTPEWFSVKSRKSRDTDYIIWSTIDLEGIVRHHYEALFDESSGYRVAYDAHSPKQPDWVYPKRTEFTRNRTTIWEKIPAS
jgi:hypothetical protein